MSGRGIPPKYNIHEWQFMMAALVMARYYPQRRTHFEEVLSEYLEIVRRALCDCDPEKAGTQEFYDAAEEKVYFQANQTQWRETQAAAKKEEPTK